MENQKRVAVYIDGFNLYHAIDDLNDPSLKWLNLDALAKSLLRPSEILVKCHYFTSIVDWNPQKEANHRTYCRALLAQGVKITYGTFKSSRKHCAQFGRQCWFREEKRTDVALGVQIVADALSGVFDRLILVTADTDQIPSVSMVKKLRPEIQLTWAAPPNRMRNAREIGGLVQDRIELKVGRIRACRLPQVIYDEYQTVLARIPPAYI
jgi:uncharacterized LabA/DUF88 family protein